MPPSILVVDDDSRVAELTARMLRAQGYTTAVAVSGATALELLLGAATCDLVIADIRMPELGGFALAQLLRIHRPTLPVLFVTGYIEDGYAGAGGLHDFLAKPFTAEELAAAVRRMLAP